MSNIKVEPNQWVEVFDENTSGMFRVYSMLAKVKRSATVPTDGGVTLECNEKIPSELLFNSADGTLKLYILNSGRTSGYVERDL